MSSLKSLVFRFSFPGRRSVCLCLCLVPFLLLLFFLVVGCLSPGNTLRAPAPISSVPAVFGMLRSRDGASSYLWFILVFVVNLVVARYLLQFAKVSFCWGVGGDKESRSRTKGECRGLTKNLIHTFFFILYICIFPAHVMMCARKACLALRCHGIFDFCPRGVCRINIANCRINVQQQRCFMVGPESGFDVFIFRNIAEVYMYRNELSLTLVKGGLMLLRATSHRAAFTHCAEYTPFFKRRIRAHKPAPPSMPILASPCLWRRF